MANHRAVLVLDSSHPSSGQGYARIRRRRSPVVPDWVYLHGPGMDLIRFG